MKTLLEKIEDYLSEKKETYEEFFMKKLKQWKIESPGELSKKDKVKFFNEIEKEWTDEDPKTNDGDE